MSLEQLIIGFIVFVVIAVCLAVLDAELESKRKYGQNRTKR